MGAEPMPRHQMHWLYLRRRGMSEVETAREQEGGQHCGGAAVGHDHTPPNCFSKDLFLSSTPHPEGLAVILVGRVGAASTSAPTELPQLFFMEENTSIDQNDLKYHLVQQTYNK